MLYLLFLLGSIFIVTGDVVLIMVKKRWGGDLNSILPVKTNSVLWLKPVRGTQRL